MTATKDIQPEELKHADSVARLKRPKAPFAYQVKENTRYIRHLHKHGQITRSEGENLLNLFRAITEMISDLGEGDANIRGRSLARRLAGYALTSERRVQDTLTLGNKHGVWRYSRLRDQESKRHLGAELELLAPPEEYRLEKQGSSTRRKSTRGSSTCGKLHPLEVELDVEVELDSEVTPFGGSTPPDGEGANDPQDQPKPKEDPEPEDPEPENLAKYPLIDHLPRNGVHIAYPEEFESFWAEYPRRHDKTSAYKKWRVPPTRYGEDPEVMRNGAIGYARFCQADERQQHHIKLPATWLNQRLWLEYVDENGAPLSAQSASSNGIPADPELRERLEKKLKELHQEYEAVEVRLSQDPDNRVAQQHKEDLEFEASKVQAKLIRAGGTA